MITNTEELMSMVESLPIDLKIKLVEKILNSLHPTGSAIDQLWVAEAEKRVDDIKKGKVKTLPGEEVFKESRELAKGHPAGRSKTMNGKNILEQALRLKVEDRFFIIEGLIKSIDHPDKNLDELWATEAEERLKAYRAGRLEGVPMEEIFKKER